MKCSSSSKSMQMFYRHSRKSNESNRTKHQTVIEGCSSSFIPTSGSTDSSIVDVVSHPHERFSLNAYLEKENRIGSDVSSIRSFSSVESYAKDIGIDNSQDEGNARNDKSSTISCNNLNGKKSFAISSPPITSTTTTTSTASVLDDDEISSNSSVADGYEFTPAYNSGFITLDQLCNTHIAKNRSNGSNISSACSRSSISSSSSKSRSSHIYRRNYTLPLDIMPCNSLPSPSVCNNVKRVPANCIRSTTIREGEDETRNDSSHKYISDVEDNNCVLSKKHHQKSKRGGCDTNSNNNNTISSVSSSSRNTNTIIPNDRSSLCRFDDVCRGAYTRRSSYYICREMVSELVLANIVEGFEDVAFESVQTNFIRSVSADLKVGLISNQSFQSLEDTAHVDNTQNIDIQDTRTTSEIVEDGEELKRRNKDDDYNNKEYHGLVNSMNNSNGKKFPNINNSINNHNCYDSSDDNFDVEEALGRTYTHVVSHEYNNLIDNDKKNDSSSNGSIYDKCTDVSTSCMQISNEEHLTDVANLKDGCSNNVEGFYNNDNNTTTSTHAKATKLDINDQTLTNFTPDLRSIDVYGGDISSEYYLKPPSPSLCVDSSMYIFCRLMVGRWETMLHMSDPLEPLFKAFGINYFKRVVVDKLPIPLTIQFEEAGLVLHALVHLPVGNRHMRWVLNGSTSFENDPDCGLWKGYVRNSVDSVEGICEGKSFKCLEQVREHETIGTVHETRGVLPHPQYKRILFIKYRLVPKNNPANVVTVLRILKPIV